MYRSAHDVFLAQKKVNLLINELREADGQVFVIHVFEIKARVAKDSSRKHLSLKI